MLGRVSASSSLGFGLALLLAAPSLAAPGVFEISQACVAVGCFPGDAPGYPIEIDAPGAYQLVGNLLKADFENVAVIQISADDVDINLQGFIITGPGSCQQPCGSSGGKGIQGSDEVNGALRTSVRNGTIRGFTYAVFLHDDARIERITAIDSSIVGIWARQGTVEDSSAIRGNIGFLLPRGGDIVRSRAIDNTAGMLIGGTLAEGRVRIRDSLISSAQQNQVGGANLDMSRTLVRGGGQRMSAETGAIRHCYIEAPLGISLNSQNSQVVENWIEFTSSLNGLRIADGARVQGNIVTSPAGIGIQCADRCAIHNNITRGAGIGGIRGLLGSQIGDNLSSANTGDGIFANANSNVYGNVTQNNTGHGISVNGPSRVVGNVSVDNTRNGLRLQSNVGYGENVLSDNGEGNVSSGAPWSPNLCGGALCP